MKDLIKITTNKDGKQLVSARELYEGLGMDKKNCSKWLDKNIVNNDFFEENEDWVIVPITTTEKGGRPTNDYAISLDFAKHLAMMARTEKSHEYRNYFIECEKKLKAIDNKAQLLLDIYNGGEKAIAASKKLHEIEAAPIKAELKEANIQLQKDKQWWAIKRVAIITNTSWKDYSWKKLKAASEKTNHEVKKVFDANFGSVNAYHEDAWKEVYPDIYKEIMK